MDFHFLVMEKSWKINVEKEGEPWTCQSPIFSVAIVTPPPHLLVVLVLSVGIPPPFGLRTYDVRSCSVSFVVRCRDFLTSFALCSWYVVFAVDLLQHRSVVSLPDSRCWSLVFWDLYRRKGFCGCFIAKQFLLSRFLFTLRNRRFTNGRPFSLK